MSQPLWYYGLTVVGRSENGHDIAHEVSALYPKYSKDETDRKLQQALSVSGPVPRINNYTTAFASLTRSLLNRPVDVLR